VARGKPAPRKQYYALVVPGLEDLAATELRRVGASAVEVLSGFDKRDSLVLFQAADATPLLRCRLIEDVFLLLSDAKVPVGRSAPNGLAGAVSRASLDAALLAHHALSARRRGRSYKVSTRVAGRQTFRREDVQAAFERAVARLLPHWVPSPHAAIEVWVHVIGPRAIVGLRVSTDELAQRRYKRAHTPASLKPTVAAALVEWSAPAASDVLVDAMCGAGTILRERAEAGPAAHVLGGDIDRAAIAAARENIGRLPHVALWDAQHLPLRTASVDAFVTNPPYGRQHPASDGIELLYRAMMREAERVLRRGGRCVVLSGAVSELLHALPRGLRVNARRRILLRGLRVTAFVMVRV
jgi:23S rRNA G2445 N2-methylase RlmL